MGLTCSRHCALYGRIISLKQDSTHLYYKVTWPQQISKLPTPSNSGVSSPSLCPEEDDTPALLHHYFALSHSLSNLYAQWAATDPNFAKRAPAFAGIRILNQDAWEALVSFICSSNNNISRISQMVQKLCLHYGRYIGTIAGEPFHDFPPPQALTVQGVESRLRELGFGYRAKYIAETAEVITTRLGTDWLLRLRNPEVPAFGAPSLSNRKDHSAPSSYRAAHDALSTLPGVGPKVADCVCLMGLGWGEAVPIDTHVWQIAQRDYKFGGNGKVKTLNKAMYQAVGDHFRKIWGPQAGWAQSVLFTANLKLFAEQAAGGRRKSEKENGQGCAKLKLSKMKEKEQEKIDVTLSIEKVGVAASPISLTETEAIEELKIEKIDQTVATANKDQPKKRRTTRSAAIQTLTEVKAEGASDSPTVRRSKRRKVSVS